MRTVKKPLAHGWLRRFNHGHDRVDRALDQINACERLVDLQRAQMALFGSMWFQS